jgi:adenine-specific DNA-methyltransferase
LSETGVIFCSIDDRNQAYVKGLFDEVFGEKRFLLNVARLTKKGGKSTNTIAINNDYIIGYAKDYETAFGQEKKDSLDKYKYEDEFVSVRGKYALTQTLDYNSLQYSPGMDYEIEIDGRNFVPGGDKNAHYDRLNGNHGNTDWVWRWSKSAVEWGINEKVLIIKNNRIYTKSYLNVRKRNGKNEWEQIDATKAYTTLSYIDNKYSNDNGKKELDTIFSNGNTLFKNPKPTSLIKELIKMVCSYKEALILDFFAGSGTTAQAVLELNKEDGGNRTFILATNNEKTDTNPCGIAHDVTVKRLKRIMTGMCYDGTKNFKWLEKNKPYGDNLDVCDIAEVANFEGTCGKTPFDVIDECLYGQEAFKTIREKIEWVCNNFEHTQRTIETQEQWLKRKQEKPPKVRQ